MSDRTHGSVRTEAPAGEATPSDGAAASSSPPVSATQAIPTTGSQRAQAPATGSTPTGATVAGSPAAAAPAAQPTGGPPGAPPVPPVTGSAPAAPETAKGPTDGGAASGRGRARGASRPGGRGPRRARLQLRHIDTWSALKISLVLSIALFFIWMVAVGVLYGVLNSLGVFDTVNTLFGQIGSASGSEDTGDVVTPGLVFGGAAVIGAINIVLMTALCTVGTFIYNLCSDLVGGLELTLSERD
ncbi:DUF3566 domain-containing protein [Blastococcus deserti]|uniref:DUF3566 domain-containing protein n=1 Tax=Blastococcus deserti TaxID=2259033 RepID=A0ABW4XCC3_9ACTN